ncbi:MAG: sortase [Chloroflexota bacterium]|nr:MAG: sortase [Chloroflexota bacterium]
MRYTLINNWSIFAGFLLAILAMSGMLVTVFLPVTISFDLPSDQGIGSLEVPLKPIHQEKTNNFQSAVVERKIVTTKESVDDADREDSSQVVLSAPNPVKVEPSLVKDASQETEALPAVQLPPEVPVRIVIPSIDLDAPVIPAPVSFEKLAGKEFMRWSVPDQFASGWHTTSAMLGETGNTVLNGHHNAYGEVFVSLVDVEIGDMIWVESENSRFSYQITNKMILPEKYEQLDVRMNNAQWLLPSIDERLTLITCWPYETNTHRLIIVARPLGREEINRVYK